MTIKRKKIMIIYHEKRISRGSISVSDLENRIEQH